MKPLDTVTELRGIRKLLLLLVVTQIKRQTGLDKILDGEAKELGIILSRKEW
jgi:hypothetical protein